MRERIIGVVVAAALIFVFAACKSKAPESKLSLKRATYQSGEVISVTYVAPQGLPDNAWVGIIPADIQHGKEDLNDKYDLAYKYLRGSTSGDLVFNAPNKPGKYDFRLHDTDNNGVELAFVTFTVAGTTTAPAAAVEQTPAKAGEGGYSVGDAVMIQWKGSWYPGKIIKARKGKAPYRIHYDGYSNSWDEWVTLARLKRR